MASSGDGWDEGGMKAQALGWCDQASQSQRIASCPGAGQRHQKRFGAWLLGCPSAFQGVQSAGEPPRFGPNGTRASCPGAALHLREQPGVSVPWCTVVRANLHLLSLSADPGLGTWPGFPSL